MTTQLIRTLVAVSLLVLAPHAAADTIHVDAGLTTGLDDGSSWADAFQGADGLQAALAVAVSGDEIFVAQGTYLASSSLDRAASFALKNGVTIWGSFAGGESSPDDRPPFGTADSVLSGDLAGDDGGGMFGDNSYHILTTAGTDLTAVIDGFVVRSGAATTGGGNRDRGAGILCIGGASPTVRNCRFIANRCTFGGAAGYIGTGGAPRFTDCTFEDGIGGSFGGAFDIAGGGLVRFDRCLFRNNTAARAGALEVFATSGVWVINSIFIDNVSTGSGGGGAIWLGSGGKLNSGSGNSTITNSILWDNEGPGGAQASANQVTASMKVNHCIVEGGFAGGVGNLGADPALTDIVGGDFTLTASSPAIDAGDNTAILGTTGVLDFAGLPRVTDVLEVADTGIGPAPVIDIGAHEFPSVWLDLGQALAGSAGTPALLMSGPLTGGSLVNVSLTDALGSATAFLVIGISTVNAPFKGGVLVPALHLGVPLPTTVGGTSAFSAPWPGGLPSGFATYYQFWIPDPSGPVGFTASNALRGTTP
ncbi:MAG: right-handed parallel beta-helix repeat-containing protein [Planctomycetota bacterium]|jgi:hypothetical protein